MKEWILRHPVVRRVTLQPAPSAVREARRVVRDAMVEAGAEDLADAAQLATSELVTNAVVHACTPITVRVRAEQESVRVEVQDLSQHLPVLRSRGHTAATGRGLQIVDNQSDSWGAAYVDEGKIVWFEIGAPSGRTPHNDSPAGPPAAALAAILSNVPLLMHWAWQEHASALLREYLLYAIERDAHVLEQHAFASDAMRLLEEQIPRPQLPRDPAALLASSVESETTAGHVSLKVPEAAVSHFAVLDELLTRALQAARAGDLLVPPTQPEIVEMRTWLCGQVLSQSTGGQPVPWMVRTDTRAPARITPPMEHLQHEFQQLAEPMLAASDAGVIVAVTDSLLDLLAYDEASVLLGERLITVIPARFREAHIAGTTLHATNGRAALLDQWMLVPAVRADGSETMVELLVQTRRVHDDVRLFVATFRRPQP